MQKVALYVSGGFFAVGAAAHLVRLIAGFDLVIAGIAVPVWMSFPGVTFATLLAAWMFLAAREGEAR